MLICGSEWNAKDNASYGFVYSSADGGKTWKQALEDKSSTWVSEESCAYGVNGVAYFVAGASKVVDDELHHELGTTHIYASHDAGRTWKLSTVTGWCDYSTSVVDIAPGPNQNRLYVYFNSPWTFYHSLGNMEAMAAEERASPTSRVGFISFKDGDATVAGPYSSADMASKNFRGSYPAPAILLNDGSILAIFTAKRKTDKGGEFLVESVRTNAERNTLEAPVKLVDSTDNPDEDLTVRCGGYYLGSAATYDPEHNKLYYVYSDVRNKMCQLFLKTSLDGGESWTKARQVYIPRPDWRSSYEASSIAIRQDGVLAMTWEKSPRSGCWIFATSSDEGRSISSEKELGTCNPEEMKPSLLNSDYLWTSFFQADPKTPDSSVRINLRNTRNGGEPHEDGIAVGADGEFHPVWIDAGRGAGEIRVAAIQVFTADKLIADATKGMENVTDRVAILYGRNQHYDPPSKTLTLDITIKNTGDRPLHAPFRIAVTGLYKNYGYINIQNANNGVTGAGAVWNVASSIPGNKLAIGATSEPFRLKFSYSVNPYTERRDDDILGFSTNIYAASSSDAHQLHTSSGQGRGPETRRRR